VLRLLATAHAGGQAILLVTHDARIASAADRVICLFDGTVVDDAAMDLSRLGTTPGVASAGPRLRMPLPDVLKLRG
jgi:putative ABC transport system ATP-binding protein